MKREPHLPIVLAGRRLESKEVKEKKKESNRETSSQTKTLPKVTDREDHKSQNQEKEKTNIKRYRLIGDVNLFQRMVSAREGMVLHRLQAIFRMYRCEYFDWESLARKLMKTPAYRSSDPVSAQKLKRVKNRSREDWRRLALKLALANQHFRIEPHPDKYADRTAVLKEVIALMMGARLRPHDKTCRPFSPSVTQAAASVRAELIEIAEAHKSTSEEMEKILSADSIRVLYYKGIRNIQEQKPEESIFPPISKFMQKKIHQDRVISDLKAIAEGWEYLLNTS